VTASIRSRSADFIIGSRYRRTVKSLGALLEGLIAGYGIAIPLGAVSVLIVNRSIDEGFRSGLGAGAGVASVDALCAATVVFAGVLVSSLLSPLATPLKLLGGAVLVLMGVLGVLKAWKEIGTEAMLAPERNSAWKAYFQFMGIAIVNPFTIVYFLALIMGGSTNWISSSGDCMMFIVGVTFASLSWQTILAGAGALAQKRLSARARRVTALIGNLIVILMGLDMVLA